MQNFTEFDSVMWNFAKLAAKIGVLLICTVYRSDLEVVQALNEYQLCLLHYHNSNNNNNNNDNVDIYGAVIMAQPSRGFTGLF